MQVEVGVIWISTWKVLTRKEIARLPLKMCHIWQKPSIEICIHLCIKIKKFMNSYIDLHQYTYAYKHIYAYIYKYLYIDSCVHIYEYTYIHVFIWYKIFTARSIVYQKKMYMPLMLRSNSLASAAVRGFVSVCR
jgi:hypothetical protein